jgi:hypothetical protein
MFLRIIYGYFGMAVRQAICELFLYWCATLAAVLGDAVVHHHDGSQAIGGSRGGLEWPQPGGGADRPPGQQTERSSPGGRGDVPDRPEPALGRQLSAFLRRHARAAAVCLAFARSPAAPGREAPAVRLV